MSDAAICDRDSRIVWARPGSGHDRVVRWAGIVLPSLIGMLAAVLVIAPLTKRNEISFLLNKDKVAVATERMRVTDAVYRGEDAKGHPFSLHAGGAVQKTSHVPVVELNQLWARIALERGPAVLHAGTASYDMDREGLRVPGTLVVESAGGYRLTTRGVGVDLKAKSISSDTRVDGSMPIGTFSGDRLRADLDSRTVVLAGRARLHIVQAAVRAR